MSCVMASNWQIKEPPGPKPDWCLHNKFFISKKAVNTVKAVKIYKEPKISEYYIYTYIL